MVVAALLRMLGVDDELIIEEFLLSDEVERANIELALRGLDGFEPSAATQQAFERRFNQA